MSLRLGVVLYPALQVYPWKFLESQDRLKLAQCWVGQAKGLAKDSAVFLGMDGCVRDDDLLRLFLDRAPSTLKRHLSGWRAWASFCMCVNWQAGAPKLAQLLDFLRGLAEGAALDRGRGRVSSARSVLSAHKLRLISLLESLGNPLVRSWKSADKWEREPTREAIPLPLAAVCALEQAVVADCAEDTWIICCILLMLHASLRWSDAQRMRVASIVSSHGARLPTCRPRRRSNVLQLDVGPVETLSHVLRGL